MRNFILEECLRSILSIMTRLLLIGSKKISIKMQPLSMGPVSHNKKFIRLVMDLQS